VDEQRHTPPAPDAPIIIEPARIEPPAAQTPPPSEPEAGAGPVVTAGPVEATAEDAVVVPAAEVEPPKRPPTQSALRRERKELWDEREATVYHVGGLAIDLRRRGLEDVELVNRRADLVLDIDRRIGDIDAALVEMDARRRTKAPPVAGYCLSCGAPYQTEAAFCFRCGSRVLPPDVPEAPSEAVEPPPADTPTAVIDMSEEQR